MKSPDLSRPTESSRQGGFRRAVLRGAGVVMPPLLTIVLFIWAWNAIDNYVLRPVESGIRYSLVLGIRDTHERPPSGATWVDPAEPAQGFQWRGMTYVPDPTGRRYLPLFVVQYVNDHLDRLGASHQPPATAAAYWNAYVQMVYLPRYLTVPIFLVVFIVLLFFLGRVFAHGVGRMAVNGMESMIGRLPIVSNVYGSVKQVTDFVFSDRDIEFNRVVAVEYPRKGIWSVGFVTGQSMTDISAAANEPVLSVLMPTSPMPVTGFTITVRKSEAVDLDLTIDQAIQFIVSCGVVVPAHQQLRAGGRSPQNLLPQHGPGLADAEHAGAGMVSSNGHRYSDEATPAERATPGSHEQDVS